MATTVGSAGTSRPSRARVSRSNSASLPHSAGTRSEAAAHDGERAAVLVALLLLSPDARAQFRAGTIEGVVTVARDGDTIDLGATAVRLNGVAAPEWGTASGRRATIALRHGAS